MGPELNKHITARIVVNDFQNPTFLLECLYNEWVSGKDVFHLTKVRKEEELYKKSISFASAVHDTFSVIIRQADEEDKNINKKNNTVLSQGNSTADEIAKLAA